MATGYDMQLTRQIGEHLVTAELGRRGFIATPFAGNVPVFDLLVADESGHSIPVQVKAIRSSSWQFKATSLLDIEFTENEQKVQGLKTLVDPDLVCIFVALKSTGYDEFYIFRLRDLQAYCEQNYNERRPNNPSSTHCAVWPKHLKPYKDNWDLITDTLASKYGHQRTRAVQA